MTRDVATFAFFNLISLFYFWASKNYPADLARSARLRAAGLSSVSVCLLLGSKGPFASLGSDTTLVLMAAACAVGIFLFYKSFQRA